MFHGICKGGFPLKHEEDVGQKVKLYTFQTSVLNGAEWSVPYSDHFIPRTRILQYRLDGKLTANSSELKIVI
jgi:hypothetical protein